AQDRHPRRVQRRPTGGRCHYRASGPVRSGGLQLSPAGHASLSEVQGGHLLGNGIGSADDPNQFPYLLRYSPYQNVKKGTQYPAVMFMTGDFDTRVDPLHARKMAALMQASTGSNRPILLKYDTKSGHSGGKP